MPIAREYVTFLARDLARRLTEAKAIEAPRAVPVADWIHHALTEELNVENRINEEARAILSAHSAQMQQLGAGYSEAFRKIKNELVRQKKAVL